nr:hypothetical protein [Streptomyces antibioticus]
MDEAAEGTKLWCGAATGLAAGTAAQLVSNGVYKQLADRPRPPREWFPHDEVENRPDSPPPSPPGTPPPR